ncbi:hypothetical protein CRG98_018761 [Punica granatum]|uniref:Uncharacterized protein n=1 Tax=Punica granatum TaxID=22663 RepID=A0A2I0JYG1_PUNGR|nr:hypothetical protein CRG98_018761 [Punica granatum]
MESSGSRQGPVGGVNPKVGEDIHGSFFCTSPRQHSPVPIADRAFAVRRGSGRAPSEVVVGRRVPHSVAGWRKVMHGLTPFRELPSSLLPYTLIGKRLGMEQKESQMRERQKADSLARHTSCQLGISKGSGQVIFSNPILDWFSCTAQPSNTDSFSSADHRYYKRQELQQTMIPYPMGYVSAPPQSSSLAVAKQPSGKAISYASLPGKRPCFLQICRASTHVSCKLAGQAPMCLANSLGKPPCFFCNTLFFKLCTFH